jgi:deazaflavin-dependent oxidoreductase (nitroreductase family)
VVCRRGAAGGSSRGREGSAATAAPVQMEMPPSANVLCVASFNDTVIEEFRANAGVLGGHWEGKTTLLLHTVGRKSGKEFVNPAVAAPYGNSYIICGSAGGAPGDPQWMANLEALDRPVTIELGADTVLADARVVRPGRDDDWDRLYGVWRAYWPDAAQYEKKTDRKFPVALITVR